MRSSSPTNDPTIWRTATARADAAPDALLPCPGCGSPVKGANLTAHVAEVHPIGGRTSTRIVGVDRRVHRTYGTMAALGLVLVGGLLVAFPDRSVPADTEAADALGAIGRSPALGAMAVGLAAMAVVAVAHRVRPPRASIAVADGTITLRYRLGTGQVRVAGPLAVETGSLVRRVPSGTTSISAGDASYPTTDVHAGTYLRVSRGRRAVTVGCGSSTRARSHWTGWTPGPTRRWWDVTLSAADFVAFQYALAAAGALVAPAADGSLRAGGR